MRRYIQMKWDGLPGMPRNSFSLYDRFGRKFVDFGLFDNQIWDSYEAFWDDIALSFYQDRSLHKMEKLDLEAKYNEALIALPEAQFSYSKLHNVGAPASYFPSSPQEAQDVSMSMVLSKTVEVPKDEELVFVWLTHFGAFATFCVFNKASSRFIKYNGIDRDWETS